MELLTPPTLSAPPAYRCAPYVSCYHTGTNAATQQAMTEDLPEHPHLHTETLSPEAQAVLSRIANALESLWRVVTPDVESISEKDILAFRFDVAELAKSCQVLQHLMSQPQHADNKGRSHKTESGLSFGSERTKDIGPPRHYTFSPSESDKAQIPASPTCR